MNEVQNIRSTANTSVVNCEGKNDAVNGRRAQIEMTDTEEKERALSIANSNVTLLEKKLREEKIRSTAQKKEYLEKAVQLAYVDEIARRKIKSTARLTEIAIAAAITLILLIVFPYAAIGFVVVVGAIAVLSKSVDPYTVANGTNKRFAFFKQYGDVYPESQSLSWNYKSPQKSLDVHQ